MCTAAATWSRWTARRTTVGEGRRPWPSAVALLGVALLSGGCAGPSLDPMQQSIGAAQRNMDMMLRQARTEAGALRAELAEARIAAAKQEAELQELRQQVSELRQTIETRLAEQAQVRAERDKLSQVKSDLQTQLVELPLLRQSLADAKAGEARAQARVKELHSALVAAGSEVEQPKKGEVVPAAKASERSKKRVKTATTTAATDNEPARAHVTAQAEVQPSATPAAAPLGGLLTSAASGTDESGARRITVLKNETLWGIARRFNLTVEEMQEANGLKSTRVRKGQTLIIPGR